MRRLHIALLTVAGGVPTIIAMMLAPSCGRENDNEESKFGPTPDADFEPPRFDVSQEPRPAPTGPSCEATRVIALPDAGDAATPEQLCAVSQPAVGTNATARITLANYSAAQRTAKGFVAMSAELASSIVGTPKIVVEATMDPFDKMVVTNMTKVAGGFQFSASWPGPLPGCIGSLRMMVVSATFDMACADGGTKTVEARTTIAHCDTGDGGYEWVSSGDKCCDCQIIAEMAPSPIVSDKQRDDLPLARVVRLRVLELARAGRQVLLFAENDAGHDLEIDWNVSGGSIERIAPDVILWTLPDDGEAPFGQVAVWNDAGAAVENFMWGVA